MGAAPGVRADDVARALRELGRGALRVAVDGGLRHLPHGSCDLWVGDGDSLGTGHARRLASAGAVIELARAKDQSDLWHALAECFERGAREVRVLGALGGRPDQELAALLDLAAWADRPGVRAVEARGRAGSWHLLGARGAREVRVPRGRCFSVLELGGGEARVELRGCRYGLPGARLVAGSHGLSNRATGAAGARVRIAGRCGRLAVWIGGGR